MLTVSKIVIDDTEYRWEHESCKCFGHCYPDKFYIDGEPYGEIDNPKLCSFITREIAAKK